MKSRHCKQRNPTGCRFRCRRVSEESQFPRKMYVSLVGFIPFLRSRQRCTAGTLRQYHNFTQQMADYSTTQIHTLHPAFSCAFVICQCLFLGLATPRLLLLLIIPKKLLAPARMQMLQSVRGGVTLLLSPGLQRIPACQQ